jgi:hypothetical protein
LVFLEGQLEQVGNETSAEHKLQYFVLILKEVFHICNVELLTQFKNDTAVVPIRKVTQLFCNMLFP